MSETECPSAKACTQSREGLASCEELAAIFRALGHPARLAIVKQLASQEEACCGEIVNHLPLAQSTVSQHLQVLKDAGLLTCDARGRNCHYLLNREKLQQAEHCSKEFWEHLNSLAATCSGASVAASDSD
ncbi:MAG: metalloregulator ArsR/SmtB family transcription factor [Roseibium sp.]|uniref:ArsR/SmtB family transcription factor n=1 Tax=Roseibium sp. TaxID=1936156 RepID=UPI00260DF981|nr:metalloregulator ArsR/SmtB family transcription factor [Roseibium sp.]MCV0425326.1 metalloregulator ArsR/SmtB family transcription factor [Roseibium sp.]